MYSIVIYFQIQQDNFGDMKELYFDIGCLSDLYICDLMVNRLIKKLFSLKTQFSLQKHKFLIMILYRIQES